ncbi:MAG: TrkH family potassium uptake protein [Peptococcaceae bacterium]|jgi:trk system potassium uptake protein TrkH|nr:TrkH family potassium uptake protein [Peptococcaceae bacterium]
MNYKMIFWVASRALRLEAVLLLVPLVIALAYQDGMTAAFLESIAVLLIGSSLFSWIKVKDQTIYAKDGFMTVALAWILISFFGALPFWFSGTFPSFIDCLFEAVSGFTTTGASILPTVEQLPPSILFWRCFIHWIGGMGVLVFMLSMVSLAEGRSIHLIRAEMTGPDVGKIVPKMKNTAKILYAIYLGMTVVEISLLVVGGMPLFDSVVHAMSTAGTGGFSMKNLSIGSYGDNYYLITVIGIFMMLFAMNFNLYYFLLVGQWKQIWKNEELRWFLLIIGFATVCITVDVAGLFPGWQEALAHSYFQVCSIISSTGFSTTDYNQWPTFAKTVLFLLMIIGACGGSTGGGIKVSRFIILMKKTAVEIMRLIHPRVVNVIKLNGKPVERETIHGVNTFFTCYMLLIFVGVFFISLNGFDFETNLSAVIACLGNVGPGFGVVGPMGSFAEFSGASKLLLSFYMLLGRLEIFPILLLVLPMFYRKK